MLIRESADETLPAVGSPFPLADIDYIVQAAHGRMPMVQFGTTRPDPDPVFPYQLLHENLPPDDTFDDPVDYRVVFGDAERDVRPFVLRHLVNVSAMSLGGINHKLVSAIGSGLRGLGLVNTGEGGPDVHLATGADSVLQVGTAKFGLGTPILAGGRTYARLDLDRLAELVRGNDTIRLIELKLSQGAKPGTVSLPGTRVPPLVAQVRGVRAGEDAVSPPQHYELLAPTREEKYDRLCAWIDAVRRVSHLPVGIKLCVGRPQELTAMVDRFARTGSAPDFITVDSAWGGTSSANACIANYVGYGDVHDSVRLVDHVLRAAGLRDRVVVCASGSLHVPAHAVSAFAHGADAVFVARGFLYAAAAVNDVAVRLGVSPFELTHHDEETLATIDVARTAVGVRAYAERFDQDVRLLTWLLGRRSPRELDLSCLRRHDEREAGRA
ncbi:glutamate synthase-related protein [Actinophytocola xanthii]|uniref:Glutamate synthase domain-containing protein n=1 Tax=Actinophytocola xanthii TaxID=1912961 RepID=A0A1Q8CK23_9PSEU|nr:glutamate synthase-related protein [Actinophytocola xanthii]OLF14689.1 hypothetical protein BU204_25700 [Actinophytocola xanthii]